MQGWLDVVAAGGCFAGLVLWYLGGSTAIFDVLDGARPFGAIALLGLGLGVAATVRLRHVGLKGAATTGLLLACGVVLTLTPLLALVNRHLDRSVGREVGFTVQAIRRSSKRPPTLEVSLAGEAARLRVEPGCAEGASGTAVIRDGALGAAWVGAIRCSP